MEEGPGTFPETSTVSYSDVGPSKEDETTGISGTHIINPNNGWSYVGIDCYVLCDSLDTSSM